MLIIRAADPSEFLPLTPRQRDALCARRGLLALAAERGAARLGYAVAESHPQAVHFLDLDGDTETCRALLSRLVRVAGERNMSGWVPRERADVRRLLRRLGFVRLGKGRFRGRPSYLYFWDRNEDL
jgi:hypothetical protein